MQPKRNYRLSKAVIAASVVLGIVVLGVGGNVLADGKIVEAVQRILHINQGRQDVVGRVASVSERGIDVYAPDLLMIDEKTAIFGTIRGLIIYDRQQEKIAGTIDLQAIDCIYFKADTKNTCVVYDGGFITIFNTENEIPIGPYYQFDLSNLDGSELQPVENENNQEVPQEIFDRWKENQSQYVDTFDTFYEVGLGLEHKNPNMVEMYSERSMKWNKDGKEQISYLLIENDNYRLVDYDCNQMVPTEECLSFETDESKENEESDLPQFVYSGEDEAVAAICDNMLQEVAPFYSFENTIWIPGFVIFEQIEEGDELLVFGNFWSYGYLLNGNVLEVESGGEYPACYHLKKENGKYKVVSVKSAGDGDDYEKDIKQFTRGHNDIYKMYFEDGNEKRGEGQKYFIQMYVKENQLDIKYFKEFGWDPVAIFE